MERLAQSQNINSINVVTRNERDNISVCDQQSQTWRIAPDDLPDIDSIQVIFDYDLKFRLISTEDHWDVYSNKKKLFTFNYVGTSDFLEEFKYNLSTYIRSGNSKDW